MFKKKFDLIRKELAYKKKIRKELDDSLEIDLNYLIGDGHIQRASY